MFELSQLRAAKRGRQFVTSLTMGAGQFCTSLGLLLAIDSPALDQFIASAKSALQESTAQTMLSPGSIMLMNTALRVLHAVKMWM